MGRLARFFRNRGMSLGDKWPGQRQKLRSRLGVGPNLVPFLIMCIISMPAMRMLAQRKDLNSRVGLTILSIAP